MDVTQSSSLYAMSGLSQMRAQMGGGPPPSNEDMVAEFDTDGSGGLSAEEVSSSSLSEVISSDNWGDVDTDGDGSLSVGELDSHREASRGDGPPPPPPPGGGGGMSDTSDASASSLIMSLFEESDSAWASTDMSLSAMASSLYSEAQEAISLFA